MKCVKFSKEHMEDGLNSLKIIFSCNSLFKIFWFLHILCLHSFVALLTKIGSENSAVEPVNKWGHFSWIFPCEILKQKKIQNSQSSCLKHLFKLKKYGDFKFYFFLKGITNKHQILSLKNLILIRAFHMWPHSVCFSVSDYIDLVILFLLVFFLLPVFIK